MPVARIALVGRTAADVRDTMIEGESGLLNVFPPHQRPVYEPSKRRVTFCNGARAYAYSADEPNLLRGPQHHFAWADELAAWPYEEMFDNLLLGLRLGRLPQLVIGTTPRPAPLIRRLATDPTVHVTRGHTAENLRNLPAMDLVLDKYEGTRIGRQELAGEILEDIEGALLTLQEIEDSRVKKAVQLGRIVVGVDPAASANENSDETGIIVAGRGVDDHAYVLKDATCKMQPVGWARMVVEQYRRFQADCVVAEVNNGGDMVEHTIHSVDPSVKVKKVRASRGKHIRFEPVASLYSQGRIHHVGGGFEKLEDQLVSFTPDGYLGDGSPDRADADVWAMSELMVEAREWGFEELYAKEIAAAAR